jgi:hypothetical protein
LTAVLIAVGVFIVVFAAVVTASYILFRWLLPKQEERPNNLLSILPIFALQLPIENAVTWIWIWLAAVFGLGLLWSLWAYLKKCSHTDASGRSVMYRERRQLGDVQDVMHLCCPHCGAAEPVIERTDEEHRLAHVAGAVRTSYAQPKAPLRMVNGGKR